VVTLTLLCPYCKSEKLVRNGLAPNGKQRYLCRACNRSSRENPASRGYSEERKEEILHAYEERSSLRGLERTFKVSRYTVAKWIKKSS
jgi:transposase-like protein